MAKPYPSLSTADALARMVERARDMGISPKDIPAQGMILHEGDDNGALFILLEGTAQLVKTGPDNIATPVDLLGPGSLLGILSFWTGKPAFLDSNALTDVRVLRLDRDALERGVDQDPEFARLLQHLLVANLSDRYRRVVGLNLKVAGLTKELENERNALREAVNDLQSTRNKLVHQEKLATMGQLLAGIAHEINNPSSALMKNVEHISLHLPEMFADDPTLAALLQQGLAAPYVSTTQSRDRMQTLQQAHPSLPRSLIRRLSRLPEDTLTQLAKPLRTGKIAQLEPALKAFELGAALHGIQAAETRITRLVKSLKSYSRQDEGESRDVKLDDCIQDTLTVLNHRLKHYDLQLDLAELPTVPCHPGEVNQVLTNLLTNACEATPKGKTIHLRTGADPDTHTVWLEVADQGHGIPPGLLERIFEPNVTTKHSDGDFGLGLGLAISRDIAVKHHGSLTARNLPEGGACFRLVLPT